MNIKNRLHKWILAHYDTYSLQYQLIEIEHYDQRWRNA
jgi:hypothetical protein